MSGRCCYKRAFLPCNFIPLFQPAGQQALLDTITGVSHSQSWSLDPGALHSEQDQPGQTAVRQSDWTQKLSIPSITCNKIILSRFLRAPDFGNRRHGKRARPQQCDSAYLPKHTIGAGSLEFKRILGLFGASMSMIARFHKGYQGHRFILVKYQHDAGANQSGPGKALRL